ncbi:MAG: aldo/keto reductase [SAR202 cluster bacterium]|nr:aldo/keto reductase [SAR202 cluster bacterium]
MNYRQLGSTDLTVSEIGFGAWGIGGSANGALGYGPTDPEESDLALRTAFDRGINFFDTSDLYGFGNSEKVIGRSLKNVRKEIILATKVGFLDANHAQDFSSEYIRTSIEGSLKRLETDYVDLYQLHSPPLEALRNDPRILPTMESLRKEGKIREFSISVDSPNDGAAAINEFGFKCVQANLNMADQRALDNGLLSLCVQKNVGFIARTPLSFGFLTGHYSSTDSFHPQDHRGKWKTEQLDRWAGAFQLFEGAVADRSGQTQAQIALRFCLSCPGVTTTIPGMLTEQHVTENSRASELGPLTETEMQRFAEIYHGNTLFA